MKIIVGFISVFVLSAWFFGPAIFSAMKKKDYGTMYQSMQRAKRRTGSFVTEVRRPYVSYAEKYAHGKLGREDVPERKLSSRDKRIERKKRRLMKRWRR